MAKEINLMLSPSEKMGKLNAAKRGGKSRLLMSKFMKSLICIWSILLYFNVAFACIPNISFIKTSAIYGKVVAEDDYPIPNAVVQIYRNKEAGEEIVAETKSDKNGRFEINNFSSGKYLIRAKADYFAYSIAQLKLKNSSSQSKTEEITFTLVSELACSGNVEVKKIDGKKVDKKQMAAQVKSEFLYAWNGYKKYAWGHDDLKPVSKTYRDWYGQTILMTPVDSLDSLYLLGFKKEADETRKYITANLSFDKDITVQNFEITIRILGGLLSSYQITKDKKLLALADDLGTRLLPVFDSPTGLPYRFVNLKTGAVRDPITGPAEAGTLLIEFGTLSKLTGKPVYFEKAKRALVEIYKRRSPIGLVGESINAETGEWTDTDSFIGSGIDSYYEYLLKCAILFDDKDCRKMYDDSIAAINKYHADEQNGELWYGHNDMFTGKRKATTYGALDAYFPAVLVLGGDIERAKRLQDSGYKMWVASGIEPEEYDYKTDEIKDAGYALRPEIVESAYYLYHYTNDEKYLQMGKTFFDDLVKYCRTDVAYTGLKSVKTKEKNDYMHSFLFAETFKYFYLLFAPPKTLDFNKVVFNTEAHPIRKTW